MKGVLGRIRAAVQKPVNEGPLLHLPRLAGLSRGRVLFSYLKAPFVSETEGLYGHSNKWESVEIARIFRTLGFDVDVVDWSDQGFVPDFPYKVVFDIYINQQLWLPYTENALRLLHLTGSDWKFQNQAELIRVENLERRTGMRYVPRRQVPYSDLMNRALEVSNYCSLLGNSRTLSTYPAQYRPKITCTPVSASASFRKAAADFVPAEREFLWFFGGGLVHKGLDVVLEAFVKNPTLQLNVIGDVQAEKDFVKIYAKELLELPNIRVHGFLSPHTAEFERVVRRCFCFIAPSCSEGTSTAVATCMLIGLYPLVSKDTGVTLPAGAGTYLDSCSVEEISTHISELAACGDGELRYQIEQTQSLADETYSRENFTAQMSAYLARATAQVV